MSDSDELLVRAGINPKKYKLGELCRHCQLAWNDTGMSLRGPLPNGHCINCLTARKKLKRARKGNRLRARDYEVLRIPYSSDELRHRFQEFDSRCAYCQIKLEFNSVNSTFDHFIPMALGGADTIRNLIPACNSCNSRKVNTLPEVWFRQQSFYDQEQWAKLLQSTSVT